VYTANLQEIRAHSKPPRDLCTQQTPKRSVHTANLKRFARRLQASCRWRQGARASTRLDLRGHEHSVWVCGHRRRVVRVGLVPIHRKVPIPELPLAGRDVDAAALAVDGRAAGGGGVTSTPKSKSEKPAPEAQEGGTHRASGYSSRIPRVSPGSCGTRRVQSVRRDGRDVSTLYGRERGGGQAPGGPRRCR